MRTITVPAGIGDNVWLLQKLINQPERLNIVLPNSPPQRGKQIFDLLPNIIASSQYSKNRNITYKYLAQNNIQKKYNKWANIKGSMFCLSANEWLENGNSLESFLPDLETSYTIDWDSQRYKKELNLPDGPLIGIYGSSYSTSRAWGFWTHNEWLELIKSIHKTKKKFTYVLIGADWDIDLNAQLEAGLKENKIPYVNTIGKPLGYVIEVMKVLSYAFYFPSGLPILSETLTTKTDCLMFYPKHLEKMMGTWRNPQRGIEFKEMLFADPETVFNWVKKEYKLFER